jgi:predicted dehydrogenase
MQSATFSIAAMKTGPAMSETRSANEKLDIAIIGVGGQGKYSYDNVRRENLVAVADVDLEKAGRAYTRFPKNGQFTDYRRMLDKMHKSLDAVIVATPDHTHFHPAYTAMDMGLHLYLEKPMAHNVWEIRKLTEIAKKNKLVTQLGMQRHTKDNMHRVSELIQSGAIGDITEAHSWIDSARGMIPLGKTPQKIPATLDYDLWLGPVEHRPYDKDVTPYGWRFWWDFGTGEAGNWGCHILDIPYDALRLDYPTHVGASGPEPHEAMTTKSMHTWFDFPAKGKRKALKFHWYQAPGGPEILKKLNLPAGGNNNLFIATNGMPLSGFDQRTLLQQDANGTWITKLTQADPMEFNVPKPHIEDSPGFHKEFLNACKNKGPLPTCNFGYSGPLSETVLLANAAYRSQSEFDWDHKTLTCKNAPAPQAHIKPNYKKGWEIGA